jgi:hypothetical protein
MERMIGAVHQMQGRRWKTTDRRLDQADLRKAVARSLQEQHRDIDFRKMRPAIGRGLAGRMQRKAQKRKAANARQRSHCLRLRGHAATKGFSPRNQGQLRTEPAGFRHRGAHGGLCDGRRIGPLAAFLHVGELIAQARDSALIKARRKGCHEGMRHPGAGTVRKNETGACVIAPEQQC